MAKNIRKRIQRIILTVLGFFGIMSFTSCYGVPPADDDAEGMMPIRKENFEMVAMYGMPPNYNYIRDDVTEENDTEKNSEQNTETETAPENKTE